MLAAVHATELGDERAHLISDGAERLHRAGTREVHERANVQATGRRMAVETGDELVSSQQLGEPRRVVPESCGVDRGVLDERDGALSTFTRRTQQAETSLSKLAESQELVGRSSP